MRISQDKGFFGGLEKSFGLDHSFKFQTQIFVWNPNKNVRISDVLVFEPLLLPNQSRLSEIRTSSDFGIPLYIKIYDPIYSQNDQA